MKKILNIALLIILLIFFCFGSNSCSKNTDKKIKNNINEREIDQTKIPGFKNKRKIVCDTFILNSKLNNNVLSLNIDSDLPKYTGTIIGVDREYWKKNKYSTFVISYFSENSKLNEWENTRNIELNNSKWKTKLEAKKQLMKELGEPFTVREISDSIRIYAVVYLQEENFGDKNKNLIGKEVRVENINYIRKDKKIKYPLNNENELSKIKNNNKINGKWLDTSKFSIGIIHVYEELGKIKVDFCHTDGSITHLEAMIINVNDEIRYYIKNNDSGEYFVIGNYGNLFWYDYDGLVIKCIKYKE